MSQVNFSRTLENGTLGDAAEVQTMLDELKTGANSIDDTNIGPTGISEGQIVFSTTGHDHDGTDSALLALATNNVLQGAVKVRRVTGSAAEAGFSVNLNAAGQSQINTVMSVQVFINTGNFSGDGHAFHTGAGLPGTVTLLNSYSSRYGGGSPDSTYWWYVQVNTSATPNEVFFYNGNLASDPVAVSFTVMMIGI